MNPLTLLETLGAFSSVGLTYYGLHHFGLDLKYWQTKDPEVKISHRDAAYVRRTWPRTAKNLKLALRDDHRSLLQSMFAGNKPVEPRIHVPRLEKITADHYGILAEFRTLHGIGKEEFEAKAKYFADAWDMTRVAVHQPKPRTIHVRAVREDPLIEPRLLSRPAVPASDLSSIPIGIDDYAEMVRLVLKSETGVGIYGAPRRGKTSLILGLMTALADHDECQFVLADGKVSTGFEGDYYDIGHRCLAVIGDSLEDYNALIKEVAKIRELRQRTIRQELGTPNFWDVGPSRAWPLLFVVIDEAHSFFEQISPAGNSKEIKDRNTLAAENTHLTADVVKKCGSVGIFFVVATQKPTSDAIPTQIRDNLTYKLCLGVQTESVAVAALGEDIKNYPDMMPTQFMRNEFRGCATMFHEDRAGFRRFRNPFTSPQLATQVAHDTKYRVMQRNTRVPLTVGRTHLQKPPEDVTALLPPVREIEN